MMTNMENFKAVLNFSMEERRPWIWTGNMLHSEMTNGLKTLLLLLALIQSRSPATAFQPTNETDKLALLAFKDGIHDDPLGVMDSWNESFHFCNWIGVSCSSRHDGRVTSLSLASLKLVGLLPPHIGNLSFIRYIDRSQNFFKSEIPQEAGHLFRLRILDLSYNRFQGKIPTNLSACSNLLYIVKYCLPFYLIFQFCFFHNSEYGMNMKASKPGDVYGFGIFLLEMITGKRPTDAVFKDGFTIHQFTKTAFPERVLDILEPSLVQEIEDEENPRASYRHGAVRIRETLVAVARIGVICSLETANERIEMKHAAAELNVIRDKFLGNRH